MDSSGGRRPGADPAGGVGGPHAAQKQKDEGRVKPGCEHFTSRQGRRSGGQDQDEGPGHTGGKVEPHTLLYRFNFGGSEYKLARGPRRPRGAPASGKVEYRAIGVLKLDHMLD